MSRKLVLVFAVVMVWLSVSAEARAGDPAKPGGSTVTTAPSPPTTVVSGSNNGSAYSVGVEAGTPGGREPSSAGGERPGSDPSGAVGGGQPQTAQPVCVWVNYDINDPRGISSRGTKVVDHVTSILQERVCDGQPTGTLRWWEIVTDESVIWATYDRAKTTVKPQTPLLGPIGVQYRSWPTNIYFTPAQLTVPAATATLPSGFFISVQPVAKAVTFHPGTSDGESFVCPTVPVAVEQCQYTYRETSKGVDDLKFFAGVSIEWDFVFTSSGPGTVTFPTATLDQPMRIPVAKIQVVGT
jgi:hypothetical protein